MAEPPVNQGPHSGHRWARWGMATVVGASMVPTVRAGDRLLVSYARRPVDGSVVLARFPDGTLVLKRATRLADGRWWLSSDDPDAGVDSRHRGAVSDQDVVAVALARLWPRPGALRAEP